MMGKRQREEVIAAGPAPKRAKSEDNSSKDASAIAVLLQNSDELIHCIGLLKSEAAKEGQQSIGTQDLGPHLKESLSSLSKRLLPALRALQDQPDQQATNETSLPIPSPTFVTRWDAATLTTMWPPLPEVLDPVMETAALTHSGQTGGRLDRSYERLEWIGDAYLELMASSFIYQTFPNLAPGKCSQYREMLVRNEALSVFSRHYGLDKRANFPDEFGLQGRASGSKANDKKSQKVLGDIFEAYVGAIILSDPKDGVRRASEWMKTLWGMTLEKHIREEQQGRGAHGTMMTVVTSQSPARPQTHQAITAKTQLETAIGCKGVKIEYRDLPSNGKKDRDTHLPLFNVGCYFTGWGEKDLQLGWGSALGKKEAGQKAAQMALEQNKKKIKKFAEKKRAYLEAQGALRE